MITSVATKVQRSMMPSIRELAKTENRKSIPAAILLTVFLAAAIAGLFANNVLGFIAILAAPFWLPLCCYFVPYYLVLTYLGLSIAWLFLSIPIAVMGDSLSLPKGFAFSFGLGALMVTIGSSLGFLVVYHSQYKAPLRSK